MPRIALRLSYDGRASHGWQTQSDGLALQDELERALSQLAQQPISTICAGRTDAGVHAVAQVVHFETTAMRPLEAWVRGVNAILSSRIAVLQAQEVDADFHARFMARRRRYHYLILRSRTRLPLLTGRAAQVFRPIDVGVMKAAAACLVGEHDYSAFRSSQCQARTPVRVIEAINFHEDGNRLAIEFIANAFLHHMIRNLVGSLLEIGTGRRPEAWLAELLATRDRRQAAGTCVPDGLYLTGVDYYGRLSLDTWPQMPNGLIWS